MNSYSSSFHSCGGKRLLWAASPHLALCHLDVTVCLSDVQLPFLSPAAECDVVSSHGQSEVASEDDRKLRSSRGAISGTRGLASTSQTLPSSYSGCETHLSMVKTAKMELLRALVSECLSAAAEEIFRIVERTVVEHEEEMSCSKWVVDSQRRLLDVAKSHSEDSFQMCAPDEQQPPASVNVSVSWEEADNSTASLPTELTDSPSSPATDDDDCEEDDVKQEQDLNTPLKILKVKKPFQCPVGPSRFSSKKTMGRHVKKHPEDKSSSYRCRSCDRYFCSKAEFIIHTRIHKDTEPDQCHDCGRSFEQRDSLFIHRQTHTQDTPYVRFSENLRGESHLTPARKMESELQLRHADSGVSSFPLAVPPYDKSEFDQESLQPLCLYQIQTFADTDSSAALRVDQIKAEADEQRLFSVNAVEQDADDKQPEHLDVRNVPPRKPSGKSPELIVQFEAGTAQKPYKCPCCTKCFSLTKTLIRHVKMHTEDKPYQCRFCGRNFCQKSDLVNHTRIHTGERPYQCQECHRSFAQKGNLVVHMRKHTSVKPYQCRECSCSFSQKASFDCHMLSHS
ncbi:zinc finger protein 260-like isoform X1 [Brachyistius frenatus]|uniref:zinc finger protein 260-like isoform X1 n=2 Tax=Brachyistius frenatus TaxID=100188 RepID=UPI0037E8D4E8